MNKNNPISLLFFCTASILSFNSVASSCNGQLYGINAGRGEVGLAFNINEINGAASVHSKALFSSAAMAFDSNLNRLYYISAPRAKEYKLDLSAVTLNDTELKSLPISAQKYKYTKIAYIDMDTKEHFELARSKPMYRLAYNPDDNYLYGSYFNKLYKIDPASGETTLLGTLSGYTSGNYMWRGDLAFNNGKLYMLAHKRVYEVDIETMTVNIATKHKLSNVTGAIFNSDGKLIISRENINDYGSLSTTEIYHMSPETGETCLASKLPVQISDLAYDVSAQTTCPETPLCQLTTKPSISVSAENDEVTEGGTLSYNIELSNAYTQDVKINLSIIHETSDSSDITFTEGEITIAAGDTSYSVQIPTTNNSIYEGTKTFKLKVASAENATGSFEKDATINDDDPDTMGQLRKAASDGFVAWHGSAGGPHGQEIRGIHGKFPGAPSGTVAKFYISGQFIGSKTVSGERTYPGNDQSTWWMNNGTVAWATLTYNGVTVNVKTGHKQQIHNHHNVDCSNGCG